MLRSRPAGRIRPQLDRLRCVLEEIGNPQHRFPSVLIVGSNGKGSTSAMLDALLRGHGVLSGLYTSPHLVRVEERIRIDGVAVSETELGRVLSMLDRHEDLTFFEMLTAAAFSIFADAGVEVAVLEAGMGGSFDATRLADSAIAGLTNIGSDHSKWLGADRADRAHDKGRALHAARRAVLGRGVDAGDLEAIDVPAAVAADSLISCKDLGGGRVGLTFDRATLELEIPLTGSFQRDNLQLAVALALDVVAEGWMPDLDPSLVAKAMRDLRWPGRLSAHDIAGRQILLDCAHNLEAAEALARHLDEAGKRYNLVFSCLDDKPVEKMAALLRPRVDQVAICQLEDERAMPIDRLRAAFPNAVIAADPLDCVHLLDDPVLAAGSIRLIGGLLAHEGGD